MISGEISKILVYNVLLVHSKCSVEFLVLKFLIGRWSAGRWSVNLFGGPLAGSPQIVRLTIWHQLFLEF